MNVNEKADSGAYTHGAECFTAAWIAGLLAAFVFSDVSTFPLMLLLMGTASFALFHLLGCTRRQCIACLVGMAAAVGLWCGYDTFIRKPLLALDGQTVSCEAKITDVRRYSNDSIRYTLRTSFDGIPAEADWYANSAVPVMQIGDCVSLDAKLSVIPSDFCYRTAEYAAGQGKYLRITSAENICVTKQDAFSVKRLLRRFRDRMTAVIQSHLSTEDAGLLLAMLFGEKHLLSEETSAALYQTGVGHVTAVSGLHLVFLCTVLNYFLQAAGTPQKLRFCIHLLVTILFAAIVDSAVSIYRAAFMLLLGESAGFFGRRGNTARSLCIAMICCTIAAPYVIGSASFWLSLSGVAGVGIFAPWMTAKNASVSTKRTLFQQEMHGLWTKLLSLLCVSIAVFPASVLLCGESSLFSPIGNLLILPLVTPALCIGMLTVLTGGLTEFLLPIAGTLCRMVTWIAVRLSTLPFSHLSVNQKITQMLIFMSFVLLIAVITLTKSRRAAIWTLGGCILLIAVHNTAETLKMQNTLRIASVGKNDNTALVLTYHQQNIVIDFSKRPQTADYVQQYLSLCQQSETEVLICRARLAAAYHDTLHHANAVYVTEHDVFDENTTICGCMPQFLSAESVNIQLDDVEICCLDDALRIQQGVQDFNIAMDDLSANQILTIAADGTMTVSAIS